MLFKGIFYPELWQPIVPLIVTVCAILVEGIMRNNSVNIGYSGHQSDLGVKGQVHINL